MTNERTGLALIGGREVRIVPKGWQHPRNGRGRYAPLLPANYAFDDEAHEAGCVARMPDASGLRADETEIVAYDPVSEGTPISPVFPNKQRAGSPGSVKSRDSLGSPTSVHSGVVVPSSSSSRISLFSRAAA